MLTTIRENIRFYHREVMVSWLDLQIQTSSDTRPPKKGRKIMTRGSRFLHLAFLFSFALLSASVLDMGDAFAAAGQSGWQNYRSADIIPFQVRPFHLQIPQGFQ
ncbi:MAG: hypothetical protein LBT40_05265 [Deltaproteobacteria bacterium]|jgi:hypothetical protein|nr:hypothetical protein [Deltaproteobacteria bacterium]